MNKSEKFLTKWNRYRKYGKVKYILIFGVLLESLYCLLFMTLILPMVDYNFNFQYYSWLTFIKNATIGVIIGPIIGFITSYTLWNYNEDKYATIMAHRKKL